MKKLTLLTSLFISFNLFAQPFSMIKEINTTATTSSFGSSLMQRVGTTVYFVANDGISGNELWKSDGTSAGTVMVKDITVGTGNTLFSLMSEGNGLLFFVANDGVNGSELWRSDGTTAGTYMLKDIKAGIVSSDINRLFFHNGFLFFGADDGSNGSELWKSDGTVAGTVMIKDIYTGSNASSPTPFSNPIYTMVALGNDVYFSALGPTDGRELYKTDGTADGTSQVKEIYPGGNGTNATNHKAAAFNGKLYFAATDGVNGIELWATDGTDAGTYRVKDIVAGSGSSQPNNLIAFNGALYFTASSTNNANPDLYKTDGTDAGTVMVRNLVADGIILTIGNSSAIDQFTIANGKLFFRGGGPNGNELYATDGTTAGTGIVKDIYPGLNSVNANGLFAYNNNVYFIGTDVELPSRSVLYKSDGTAVGTVQLTDGASGGALGMGAITMTSAGGKLFFWGNTNDNGSELWSTDGTNANTTLVKDINTIKIGTPNSGSNAFGTLVHNGYYYYAAVDNTYGNELWKSDGTTAGTVIVKDIWPGKAPSNPAQFFVYGGAIYFTASDGVNGTELWKTDGTDAGTVMVVDINPGSVNSGPNRFFISNNFLYFTAYHPSYGIELWRSDGTAAGTTMVIDLITGAGHGTGSIIDVISIGSNAYAIMGMVAGNVLGIPSGSRLIKIDGVTNTISDFASVITAGTDLGIVGNTLYITGRNAANQTLLWKSENGGVVSQVKILSTTSTNAYQLTNCGGKLYFSASNGTAAGQEPWISDGTDAGTYMLKDINPGANPSTPYQFVFSGGKVFFTASSTSTNNSEYELWATDGTTGGTYLVKDILPGSTGSRPNSTISAFGNKVLFTANNGTNGYELWQSDGTSTGTFQLQEFNTNGDGLSLTGILFNFPADYFYQKLGDKIVFFARSADKGLQLYSGNITSPYKYVNDNSTTNDVYTTAVGNNANNGSQSAPYATVSYAISQAQAGDTIYVDAGIFFEQVTIDKGITLIGAGSGVTIVWKPAVINPPPGPFTEPGTIQTTQNIGDVHIRDMSVTGDNNGVTPIILQTGGSVKNCRLIGGNQGIFFRVNPAIKTALIENNYIVVEYIGINCQGSGLSATLINNTIELTNPFFAAGVFAGLDFGPLVRFTAFGNIIRNYNAQGMLANSFNTNITQNSFTGTGAYAIQQSTNSLGFATCNWYGTTDAGAIASKISGFFSYSPYLTNGTNTITTYGNYGFLPVAGTCAEGVSNFYVNDNSTTNDVFTTAVGNNSNTGTRSAPFATLSYAISVAPANSVIHVDAGTYAEQVIIDRAIIINGAGKDLANFIKPATPLVPAPGPFTEIGLFETTQGIGDVHIRNISVNSVDGTSQNIIIQAGGSVKNCKLLNGGQGVFFRIASGSRYAEVSFNTIQPTGIGINCQGAGLTANIVNNTISNPAGYYSGIFAGLDFGPLPQLTITNNKISDYFSLGILANANSSNITNNSIIGTASSIAISGNALNATCNWYGTTTPAISGPINYSPFLTNGTDNNATELGFQPVPGTCTGVQHKFYVNDNDNTGNVFTTAVGNDVFNNGSPAAPLLTIAAALTKAQAGDTIYVDAGTYTAVDGTIGKSITMLGANYLTTPNDAANPLNANSSRVAETFISNTTWTIGANDIWIKGFTFDPQSKTALAQTNNTLDFDNVEISKNIFWAKSTSAVVNLTGKQQSPLVTTNYVINDNRFVKESGGGGNNISINAIDAVQINNNVFTTNNTIVNNARIQNGIVVGNLAGDVVISNNKGYQQNFFINALSAKKTTISFNSADECNRFAFASSGNMNPNELEITDNIVTNPRSTGGPVISYARSNGTNLSSPNIARIERNTIILNGTGLTSVAQALIAPTLDAASANTQVYIRDNKLTITGDFSTQSNPGLYVSAIRFLTNSRYALVENNEMEFTAINYNGSNKFGIGLLTSGLQPGTGFNFLNNKFSGFPTSIGIQNGGAFGGLPAGVELNINYNSFTGDVMSINNGTTGQSANAGCNWYGSAAAQNFISKLTLPTVDIVPWLTNGTDNNAATGFQPVPNSCDGYPTLITLNNTTNVTCNGAANGTINITTSYGKAPFTYTWTKDGDANFVSNNEDLTGLAPGTYRLAITDGNGSNIYIIDENADGPGTIVVTITQPDVLTATGSGTNNLCFGETNGTASVLAEGGTAPYTYLWSNGATSSSISNLIAGNYSVTVTDDNGCTVQASYDVTQPALLTVSITNGSTGCSNNATAVPNGGTAPYSYLWSNTSTVATISSVQPGTYNVLITDNKGCTASANITLAVGEAFNPSASVTNVTCFGASTGIITVTNANGTAPFTFSIDGVNFESGSLPYSFTGLAAGNHTIAVRDFNGCTGFVTKTITQPTQLIATLGPVQSTCSGQSTGSISVIISGGSPTYSYQWSGPGVYSSSQLNISNLAAGAYTLTVTDSKGCITVLNAAVPSYNPINVNVFIGNVICRSESNGYIDLTVSGGTNTSFNYAWNNGATTQDRFNLAQGTYNVTIQDNGSGCILPNLSYSVIQAGSVLKLNNPVFTNVRGCTTADLGTITASATGGVRPCQFKLNNGNYQQDSVFTGLATGLYAVYVKDAYGCEKSAQVTIGDDGTDKYERINNQNNNNKGRASVISVGSVINARIASVDQDWFKFTTLPGGMTSYTISVTHPSFNYSIVLYKDGINTVRAHQSSTPTSKTYLLGGDTTFQVQITGTVSQVCYSLLVQPPLLTRTTSELIVRENKLSIDKLNTSVFPNPHRGAFGIKIESAHDGTAIVELMNSTGQLIGVKRVAVNKGGVSIVNFTNMRHSILFYRVIIGNEVRTGKIIGPN